MKGQILEYKGEKYKLHENAYACDCGTVYQAMAYKVGDKASEINWPLTAYFVIWQVCDGYDSKVHAKNKACNWDNFKII